MFCSRLVLKTGQMSSTTAAAAAADAA